MDQPPWLQAAWAAFGVSEASGSANASDVLAFYREAGHGEIKDDRVPWCAAFLGAMLKRSGIAGTGSLLARSYLAWGDLMDAPRIGAITVLARGDDPNAGHVGFLLGQEQNRVFLLGGNQSDTVSVEAFDAGRVLAYRWPSQTHGEVEDNGIFQTALKHVLEMEGGFSDDPYDPGGPTNRGITLREFAAWQRETLDTTSQPRLLGALKQIPDDAVAAIYRERYWLPSSAALLPHPLAIMHFDASVNHGTGGARRMLQAALGVTADGEIGLQTLEAARASPPQEIIARYADMRRKRYRALPHFWRFGRGWLRRVDATEALAQSHAAMPPASPQTAKGTPTMSHDDEFSSPGQVLAQPLPARVPATEASTGKWWVQSKTVWGALITAATTVLPIVGPMIGLNIPADVIKQFGEQTAVVIQAIGGILGTLLTLYGRARATLPLARRIVDVRL